MRRTVGLLILLTLGGLLGALLWPTYPQAARLRYASPPAPRPPVFYVMASDAPGWSKMGGPNVKICDGTADEEQIQAANDALVAGGGGIIELSSGTFTLSAAVTLGQGVTLKGQGWLAGTGGTRVVLLKGANCNGIEPDVDGAAYVRLENFHLDGNRANQTGASNGVSDTGSKGWGADLRLTGMLINHWYTNVVNITGSDTLRHFIVRDCTLEYVGGTLINIDVDDDKGHKLMLAQVDLEATPGEAIAITGFNDAATERGKCAMVGCVVKDGDSAFTDFLNLTMSGNVFQKLTVTTVDSSNITGNVIEGAFTMDNCDYVSVSGNRFESSLDVDNSDSSTGSTGISITGNTFEDYLDVDTLKDFNITGNTVGQYVQFRHCLRGTIAGNEMSRDAAYAHAFYFDGADDSDYLVIADNGRTQTDGTLGAITGFPTSGTHNFLSDTHDGVRALNTGNQTLEMRVYTEADMDDNETIALPDTAIGHGIVMCGADGAQEGGTFAFWDDATVVLAGSANFTVTDADNKLVVDDGGDTAQVKNTLGDDKNLTMTIWFYIP